MSVRPLDLRRFDVAQHVDARPFHSELVILDLASGGYFALDSLGTRVWRGLSAGESLGAIVDALAHEYDVPLEVLTGDISAFTDELKRRGLLVERP